MAASRQFFGRMQAVTSCISVTLVLMLLGCAVFFGQVMHRASRYMRENLEVTAMISDDATDEEVALFASYLRSQSYVVDDTLITREQALSEQTEALGIDPTEFLGVNPFSASIDIRLQAEYANSDSLFDIAQRLRASDLVTEVIYQKDIIDDVNNNVNRVMTVLLIIAALLAVVSLVLINNTVRLSIYSRRFAIRTMRLVGASWGFIRRPFMIRALLMGLVSAFIATALLLVGIHALLRMDPGLKEFVTTEMKVVMTVSVFAVGLLITVLCSYFTVNHYLKMRVDRMY